MVAMEACSPRRIIEGAHEVRLLPPPCEALCLWTTAMLKGFGRRPFSGARGSTGGRRSKPRKEETAGRKGGGLAGRDLSGI